MPVRPHIAPALLAATLAVPAGAEVVSASATGFVVRSQVTVAAEPAAAYRRFLDIGSWWDPEHSYSGDSRNLTLRAEPGGCFCETLPQRGFVEHLRVVFVQPGKLLRLEGGLGPLQEMGASGVMTLKFEPAQAQTLVTLTYVVSGYLPGKGLGEVAEPVDKVLLEQLQRFVRKASSPGP